jgi:ribonuclease-3
MRNRVRPLEEALGYCFETPALLSEALTHSTFANEHAGCGPDNERLEFLGDAVLGLLVSRLLFERFSGADEGELSRRRARVVRKESIASLARELELGSALRLGEGQKAAEANDTTLADAYEALLGAVFLDGGFAAVERCFATRLSRALDAATAANDYKTALQEVCHARGLPPPKYEVASVRGPDHARMYACEVAVGPCVLGRGEGTSKKTAEQVCAAAALRALEASKQP